MQTSVAPYRTQTGPDFTDVDLFSRRQELREDNLTCLLTIRATNMSRHCRLRARLDLHPADQCTMRAGGCTSRLCGLRSRLNMPSAGSARAMLHLQMACSGAKGT